MEINYSYRLFNNSVLTYYLWKSSIATDCSTSLFWLIIYGNQLQLQTVQQVCSDLLFMEINYSYRLFNNSVLTYYLWKSTIATYCSTSLFWLIIYGNQLWLHTVQQFVVNCNHSFHRQCSLCPPPRSPLMVYNNSFHRHCSAMSPSTVPSHDL